MIQDKKKQKPPFEDHRKMLDWVSDSDLGQEGNKEIMEKMVDSLGRKVRNLRERERGISKKKKKHAC